MSQTTPRSLDRIDPVEAWAPWSPDSRQTWNLKWAGHLYRRAGFGAPLSELQRVVRQGLPQTLSEVFGGSSQAEERGNLLDSLGERMARQNDPAALRGWWVYCMLHTQYPLREKLTLFWHNHFATSTAKVQQTVLMYKQNQLLRRHALGKFREFLLDVSRDPAMLVWLDSNNNVKGRPNENYARELLELFSLGVGHYTEVDIQEAARAFTGWHTNGEKFDYSSAFHDDGPKTVLNQGGNWNGEDIVRIALEQPAAAHFLIRKLYRFFVSETAQPPAQLLEPLAAAFRQSDYDIGLLLRTILSSRHFFSAFAYRQRIKSPVEFVIGTIRALQPKIVPPTALVPPLDEMGQSLFAPPNVKGWEGGRAWLNTATVLARHNFADRAVTDYFPVEERFAGADKAPEQVVGELIDSLLDGDANGASRSSLVRFLAEGKPRVERVREVAHAIMTMPEYQLA